MKTNLLLKKENVRNNKRRFSEEETKTDSIIQPVNHEHKKILEWFRTVKFRKVTFGGIDERYLWKKLDELNHLYETALSAERARYDALLEEQKIKNGGDNSEKTNHLL